MNLLIKPGQVDIVECKLLNTSGNFIDLIENGMVGEINLHEDIFSNCLSGFIIVTDTMDVLSNFKLTGDERLSVILKTPTLTSEIREVFHVYKMQGRETILRNSNYILNFCSIEQIISENNSISKHYSGKISDSVGNIFTKWFGDRKLLIEPTTNDLSFIPAHWSPIKTINWLTSKSISPDGFSDYMFFQTTQSYEYVPLSKLIEAKPVREYVCRDFDAMTASDDIEEAYRTAEIVSQSVSYDYLKSLNSGMYAGKMYTFDITNRQIKRNTFDYIDDAGKRLNDNPLMRHDFTRSPDSNINYVHKNDYLFGKKIPVKYDVLKRASSIAQLNSFKLTIRVHGRTDMKIGTTIKLKATDFRNISESEINDNSAISDYYSGKYLVTAIRHVFSTGNVHEAYIEIVKDSFL